jgi:nucleotide-binding universal stress UspA family protein
VYNEIVVGTDFSKTAAVAVDQAAALAKAFDARLHVVTAFKPALTSNLAATSLETMSAGGAELLAEAESRIADEVEATLKSLGEKLGADGIRVKVHGLPGDAADALIDIAEEVKADLIVVGNRGMTGARRFILGSVSNKVTHHAPCSVLVVHTTF